MNDNYYDYYDYDPREVPAEDPYLRKLLDCQYTPEFEAYCNDCKFRAHGSARPTANCWPSIREKMHCYQAFANGKQTSAQPDYSDQISAVCNLLSSIDSKTDDPKIDVDESMLSSETFQKIDKLGKLVSPGFDTDNITASEWIKLMLVARKLRLQV